MYLYPRRWERPPTAEVSWRLGWDPGPPPPRRRPGHSEEPLGWTPQRYLPVNCKRDWNTTFFFLYGFWRNIFHVLWVLDNQIFAKQVPANTNTCCFSLYRTGSPVYRSRQNFEFREHEMKTLINIFIEVEEIYAQLVKLKLKAGCNEAQFKVSVNTQATHNCKWVSFILACC